VLVSPEATALLDGYLARCAAQPTGTAAPAPPLELAAFPLEERMAMALGVMAAHRAGDYRGPAWFGAEKVWSLLLASVERVPTPELLALLHAVAATGTYLCGYPWRYAWEHAQAEIRERGISRPLHDALRAMQGSMRVHTSDKNAALQIDRALYFETFSALDPAADVADVVRAALRALPADRAAAWQVLLLHGMNGTGKEAPTPTCERRAEPLVRALGTDFDATAARWLAEVAGAAEIRLSRAGAEALRALVWATARRPSPPVDALVAMAQRPWRRGPSWSSRHERFVGAIAWALALARPATGLGALRDLDERFGRTSAKDAIGRALQAFAEAGSP
jgi:hypothetical protein